MSQDNVEIVLQLAKAVNAGGDEWIGFYDTSAEYHTPPEWPEDRVYRGREALRGINSTLTQTFDDFSWQTERAVAASHDCVVWLGHARGRMRESGARIEQRVSAVYYFRDKAIVRALTYLSWDEALKAAGLEE